MKVLVTGAAGFLGYHLVNRLVALGIDVAGIDNWSHACGAPTDRVRYADVRYSDSLENYIGSCPSSCWDGCDAVVHLAAQIHVDKSNAHLEETVETNVMGTLKILEGCLNHGVKKFIFASTSEVYGTAATDRIDENHRVNCQSIYATSKLSAEKIVGNFHALYGLQTVRIRCFNLYGPWQNEGHYGGVIARFAGGVLAGQNPVIYGDGLQERDYLHVSDAVEAYVMALTETEKWSSDGGITNVGTGESYSILSIAQEIIRITGQGVKPEFTDPRPEEVRLLRSDITRARSLGWEPKVCFGDGLRDYIEWRKSRNGIHETRKSLRY